MAQFVASGGDWGDPVTEQMAVLAPSDVLGIHLNMPSAVPAEIAKALESGGPPQHSNPAGLRQRAYPPTRGRPTTSSTSSSSMAWATRTR